jgi:hypothetical protein
MSGIIIVRENCPEDHKFKILFNLLMKYLHELRLFNKFVKSKITTGQLWDILIKDKKYDLIKVLKHVENKEPGYGSVVVPKYGFSSNRKIHNLVLLWLKERDINIVDVDNTIAYLEDSLKI